MDGLVIRRSFLEGTAELTSVGEEAVSQGTAGGHPSKSPLEADHETEIKVQEVYFWR